MSICSEVERADEIIGLVQMEAAEEPAAAPMPISRPITKKRAQVTRLLYRNFCFCSELWVNHYRPVWNIFFYSWLFKKIDLNLSTIYTTVCPRSSDPFYIVSYYIKWVTTSWTYSIVTYDIKWVTTSWTYSIV